MRSRIAWTILVLVVVLIMIALMRFNLTALKEPGSLETSVANWGTHFLIRRASRLRAELRRLMTSWRLMPSSRAMRASSSGSSFHRSANLSGSISSMLAICSMVATPNQESN